MTRHGRRAAGTLFPLWTHPGQRIPIVPAALDDAVIESFPEPVWGGRGIDDEAELAVDDRTGAVGIFAHGYLIGHMGEADSARFSTLLQRLTAAGQLPTAPISVWWADFGAFSPQKWVATGHHLTLAAPHLLVPMNQPPKGAHLMLPLGVTAQVTGEESYQDALRPWLRPEGEGRVYATLHSIEVVRPRSTITLVEVRIEGLPVGTLSKTVSDQMLGLVDQLVGVGVSVACRATVRGNALAAEVAVHPRRPSTLSNQWLEGELRRLMPHRIGG